MTRSRTDYAHEAAARRGSVGILHAGALGDCVLALHVAMALWQAGHTVTVIARSPIAAWAARRKLIDQFIWLDRVQWLWRAGSPATLSEAPREHQALQSFDVVISFLGGAGEEVSDRLEQMGGRGRVVHIDPKPTDQTVRDGTHITQQWSEEIARQLRTRGGPGGFEIPNLNAPTPSLRLRDEVGEGAGLPGVLVHPGSGGQAKCCPLDAMEALVVELKHRRAAAKWMIGPDEMERDGPALRDRLARTAPVVFEESIEKAAEVVARAGAFIGNDSGMTHVAGLTGITTVALFGPTDPGVWGPIGQRCHVHPFPEANKPRDAWLSDILARIGT